MFSDALDDRVDGLDLMATLSACQKLVNGDRDNKIGSCCMVHSIFMSSCVFVCAAATGNNPAREMECCIKQ